VAVEAVTSEPVSVDFPDNRRSTGNSGDFSHIRSSGPPATPAPQRVSATIPYSQEQGIEAEATGWVLAMIREIGGGNRLFFDAGPSRHPLTVLGIAAQAARQNQAASQCNRERDTLNVIIESSLAIPSALSL
jgi:hypothetical protein